MRDTYEEQLSRALPLSFLAITDVTDGHAAVGVKDGRALSGDGRDILVLTVSNTVCREEAQTLGPHIRRLLDQLTKPTSLRLITVRGPVDP